MHHAFAGVLRKPSWWAEGVQIARWDPFGFGILTLPMLLFVMPSHWFPQAWILFWTIAGLGSGGELFHLPGRQGRTFAVLAMAFLGWMWSSVFYGAPAGWLEWVKTGINGTALALFLLGLWRVARKPSRLEWMLKGVIGFGVVTAAISIPVFYFWQGHRLPADRLGNVIPYLFEGLYAVNSGMLWAFAGVACAAGFTQSPHAAQRTVLAVCLAILTAAVLFSQTRGALLGMGAAFAVLILTRPLPKWSPLVAVIAVTGWTCQNLPVLIPALAPSAATMDQLALATPGEHMLSRADSGRLGLYQELYRRVEGATEVIMGRGFWARDTALPIEISWPAPHPHSAWLSTVYHGGLIGLTLLGLLIWSGARQCIWICQRGIDVRWLAFLASGGAALCFDGHTLALFQTVPHFEVLLFWVPLVTGASLAAKVIEDTPAPPAPDPLPAAVPAA